MPVDKGVKTRYDFEKDGEVEVIHRKNVLLSGTSVTSGECRALAVNVGPRKYIFIYKTSPRRSVFPIFQIRTLPLSHLILLDLSTHSKDLLEEFLTCY